MAEDKRSRLFWFGVALMILLILGNIYGGIFLGKRLYPENPAELKMVSLFATILLVFILVLLLGYSSNHSLNRGEMRRSIAAVFVVTLIVILFFSIQVKESLLNFFLGVLATVVGFYFGSRKVIEETQSQGSEEIKD
jgi:FtsH-binding integral membrane protein